VIPTGPHVSDTDKRGILIMKAKSVKWVFGLAAVAVGTSGAMMLAPAAANAATAHPAHMQTASNVSKALRGGHNWYGPGGDYTGGPSMGNSMGGPSMGDLGGLGGNLGGLGGLGGNPGGLGGDQDLMNPGQGLYSPASGSL
jgi:hypothetical protein